MAIAGSKLRTPSTATPDRALRKRGARRAEIVRVAKHLFATHGFQGTSLRDIGDAAGVLPGSLYHHFKTKDEILDEIVRDFLNNLLRVYQNVVSKNTDSRSALHELVRSGIKEEARDPDAHTILFYEFKYLSSNSAFSYIEYILADITQIWFGVLQEGVRSGKFRRTSNIHLTIRVLMNALNGTVTSWLRRTGQYSLDELIDAQLEILFQGIDAV